MTQESNAKVYPAPFVTADVVALTRGEGDRLRVLLIQRGRDPFAGSWALPGGFCEPGETVEEGAARELKEETNLENIEVEQFYTFSTPGRDPRGWVISVAHLAIVPEHRLREASGGDDASDAKWWDIIERSPNDKTRPFRLVFEGVESGPLAFDHDAILTKALLVLDKAGTS